MVRTPLLPCLMLLVPQAVLADEPFRLDRCQIVPLPGHQASFRIDGIEKLRWCHAEDYPRPFFYPFNGPSGGPLTRMGHPGAPNHDHHQSVWFAHLDVNGVDFWGNGSAARIRQKQWYAYRDGQDEAVMALLTGWYDSAGRCLMEQEIVTALISLEAGEHALEIQTAFRPANTAPTVQLGKTNFGFLAVRVAKSLSDYFGGGRLTNSEGESGEADLFGQAARWMDYSGPVAVGTGPARTSVIEGITFFDHPRNPRYPTRWHVRDDGWMGASFCMQDGYTITHDEPLTLRYLLHAHASGYDHRRAESIHNSFRTRPGFRVGKGTRQHHQYEVTRSAQHE